MITDADHLAHLRKGTMTAATQVAESENASGDVLDHLLTVDWIKDHAWTRRCIARHPNLSDAGKLLLSTDHNEDVLYELTCNPSLTSEMLADMYSSDAGKGLARGFASNPNLPAHIQVAIAKDHFEDSWTIKPLAMNPSVTPEAIAILIETDNGFIRKELARSRRLTIEQQWTLAEDENEWVRSTLASNSSVDVAVLDHIARNDSIGFSRKAVANNAATAPDTVRFLMEDENKHVAWAAKKNRNRHG